jgi:hypothetical protein
MLQNRLFPATFDSYDNGMDIVASLSFPRRMGGWIVLCPLLALFLACPSNLQAAAGTEGATFLNIPVGAGPASLGGAYSALASDAYAPNWNPAGLGLVDGPQIAAQHLDYLAQSHYEFLSGVYPLSTSGPRRAVGASVQYLGSGAMTGTDDQANPTGDFSSYYAAYNLSYGQTWGRKLSLGVTGKLIHARLDDVTASAYAVDLGTLFMAREDLVLAGVLTNVGSKLTFVDQADSLPLAFRLGAAYRRRAGWILTADAVFRKTGQASLHMGTEWKPAQAIALRLGYKTSTVSGLGLLAGLTMGFGVNVWGQELAYAWLPMGDLGSAHYLSLVLRLGKRRDDERLLTPSWGTSPESWGTPRNSIKRSEPIDVDYENLRSLLESEKHHEPPSGAKKHNPPASAPAKGGRRR